MNHTCILFGASPAWGDRSALFSALTALLPSGDFHGVLTLCADGGISLCQSLGLVPALIIGDFDSSREIPAAVPLKQLPPEKDVTDLHACVDYALAQGCLQFFILGCTGGRLDHFLSAAGMLEYMHARGADAVLLDADNAITLHTGGTRVFHPPHRWKYLSVLPLEEKLTGVDLSGLKYPLVNATLSRAGSLGVSNEPLPDTPAKVAIQAGRALIVRSGLSL